MQWCVCVRCSCRGQLPASQNRGSHVCIAAAEKNLEALKGILERLPSNACLCFVGDGPSRPDLAKHFEGLPVYFTVSPNSLFTKTALPLMLGRVIIHQIALLAGAALAQELCCAHTTRSHVGLLLHVVRQACPRSKLQYMSPARIACQGRCLLCGTYPPPFYGPGYDVWR